MRTSLLLSTSVFRPDGAALNMTKAHSCRGMPLCLFDLYLFNALLDALLDRFGFGFVAWFFEKSEHVFLVSFHAGLVEGIDVENISADAAGCFEEVDQLAEI